MNGLAQVVLSAARFPAILSGWAMEQLTVRGLQQLVPDAQVQLSGSDNDGGAVTVSLGAFAAYMLLQAEGGPEADDEPLAVFDSFVLDSEDGAPLRALYCAPDVPALDFRRGLLERLPLDVRPPAHYLLLGAARSGTVLHQDPPGMSTWNVVTTGRKRWAMCSPLCPAALADRNNPPEGCDWSIAEWFAEEWPSIKEEAHACGWAAFDFEHAAGELVYVPPGWWHAVLNLEQTVALNHTVLHAGRLRRAAVGAPSGERMQRAEAVLDAFKLVDEEAVAQWLDEISAAEPNLLPPLGSSPAATAKERPWGCWGGISLAPVGGPWVLPAATAHTLRAEALAALQRAGMSVCAVFGKMYPVPPYVLPERVSQSDAVCVPAAQLSKLLQKDSEAAFREAGITVTFEPEGAEDIEASSAVVCRRADDCLLLHVLDGCAIRHHECPETHAQPRPQPRQQPEPEPEPEPERPTPANLTSDPEAIENSSSEESLPPPGGQETLEALLRHVLGVLHTAGVECSLVFGTLLGKLRDGAIMTHDHDCDLLLAATDAARILELAAELEAGGRYMFVACTDLLNHMDSADCEHTLDELPMTLSDDGQQRHSIDLNTVRPALPDPREE